MFFHRAQSHAPRPRVFYWKSRPPQAVMTNFYVLHAWATCADARPPFGVRQDRQTLFYSRPSAGTLTSLHIPLVLEALLAAALPPRSPLKLFNHLRLDAAFQHVSVFHLSALTPQCITFAGPLRSVLNSRRLSLGAELPLISATDITHSRL